MVYVYMKYTFEYTVDFMSYFLTIGNRKKSKDIRAEGPPSLTVNLSMRTFLYFDLKQFGKKPIYPCFKTITRLISLMLISSSSGCVIFI